MGLVPPARDKSWSERIETWKMSWVNIFQVVARLFPKFATTDHNNLFVPFRNGVDLFPLLVLV